MLGYAVECALKASAARRFQEHTVPEKAFVNHFYTHRLDRLLEISGVADAFEARRKADPVFQENWATVRGWSETSRYDGSIDESSARDMLKAVTDRTAGILTWVRTQW